MSTCNSCQEYYTEDLSAGNIVLLSYTEVLSAYNAVL